MMTTQQYIIDLEAHINNMQKALDTAADWIAEVKITLGVTSTAEVIPAILILKGQQPLKIDEVPIIYDPGSDIVISDPKT